MAKTTLKTRWMAKLARTKNFIIVTDTESIISLRGINPKSFNDTLMLASQRASLERFRDNLEKIIKMHDKGVQEAMKPRKPGKKITVKKGR